MFNNYDQIEVSFRTNFLYRVYGWMTAGLALTALVATAFGSNVKVMHNILMGAPALMWGAIILQMVLVWGISLGLNHMSYSTALAGFLAYSMLSGFTLSVIFLAYSVQSIAMAAFVTAGMFAATATYGYVTKKDLSSWSMYLMMGLFGIIIANIANIFVRNNSFDLAISCVAVILFTALTAYDVQRLKVLAFANYDNEESMKKMTLMGALILYLDVINLFVYLLNILGRRRD